MPAGKLSATLPQNSCHRMPPILHSQRLRLRPPRQSDLENIYRLGSNAQVMQYITPGRVQSRSEAASDLEKRIATTHQALGYWIVEHRETNAFIGWMALKALDQGPEIEIGYRFLAEHWGCGYATEGGRRILSYAFLVLRLDKVVAVAIEENRASTRVMEKLGMHFCRRGNFYGADCVCYEIQRAAFLEQQAQGEL